MDVLLWLILLVGLIMCIEFQNTSADPDITTLHVGDDGSNQCSIKIKMPDITKLRGEQGNRGGEGSKGERGLVGDEGFAGKKGDKGQKGLHVIGDKGEKGDKGLKGETGFDGEIGYPGSKGAKGEKGVKGIRNDGIKGAKGAQGLNGTESGEPGDDGPSGDKGDNGDTGSIGRKGLDGPLGNHCIMRLMDTDTDTETTCDSILEALGYYDDVDAVSKAFDIACDDDMSEVCIRETKDTSLVNHKAENFWLSDVGIDVRNIYGLKSKQIYWLKKKSISIRQTIVYNCENSIAFSKANVSKSIQLLSWNEKLIGPIATKTLPLNYVVPEATNQCADGTSGTSHIEINSDNTNRLPITDIRINDIRDTTQKVSVKNLELCFKWK